MNYTKPNKFYYRIAQAACRVVSKVIFQNKVLRNEIRGKGGPFVVIANHECVYDFANLICTTSQPMSFVISRSFFSSLPIKGFLEKMGEYRPRRDPPCRRLCHHAFVGFDVLYR